MNCGVMSQALIPAARGKVRPHRESERYKVGQCMVTAGDLTPTIKLFPQGKEPVHIDLFSQGGGRRGAATAGFLFGLSRFEDIKVEGAAGTSAGAMANAVLVHGLAKEQIDPTHDRQDTRLLLARLYRVVTDYSPYNVAQSLASHTRHNVEQGQRLMFATPFAALTPFAYMRDIASFGQAVGDQFKTCSDALTRAMRVTAGHKHILALVMEDVIGNTKAIMHPTAPLLVNNVVRENDDAHMLLHNRQTMGLSHIVASGALTAYLPPVDVPGVGICRDGAQGGANPPILDYFRLKQALLPEGRARIAVLYNLSDPDGSLKEELKARDPKLHGDFHAAMERQKQELAALRGQGHDIRVIQAALTREQRQESLSDTDPDKMRAMFQIGVRQGEELGFKLVGDELGIDARKLLARRPAQTARMMPQRQAAHH